MIEISNYLQDGANYQAQAVLAIMPKYIKQAKELRAKYNDYTKEID